MCWGAGPPVHKLATSARRCLPCVQVLLALCSRLYGIQQLRKGLASRLLQIMQGPAPAAECSKQHLIDGEINVLHLQLRGTAQVGCLQPSAFG